MPFITFFGPFIATYYLRQLRLQDPSINVRDAASDISELKDVLHQERNCNASGIEEIVIEGKELAEKMELDESKGRKKKR